MLKYTSTRFIREEILMNKRFCANCFKLIQNIGSCEHCGFNNENINKHCLNYMTIIGDIYIVGRAININGEAITYMAFDTVNKVKVKVKEFFPSNLVNRKSNSMFINSGEEEKVIKLQKEFDDIARRLINSNESENIEKPLGLFHTNQTSYFVTELCGGITLEDYIQRRGSLETSEIIRMFEPLMDTLSRLSSRGIKHLGISPSTVKVCVGEKLVLTDFSVKALRVKTGIIPCEVQINSCAYEQYYAQMQQKEYTDVYGLASCIYFAITQDKVDTIKIRYESPKLLVPTNIASLIPNYMLTALGNALKVLPEQRTLNFESFKMEFLHKETKDIVMNEAEIIYDIPSNLEAKNRKGLSPYLFLVASIVITLFAGYFVVDALIKDGDITLGNIIEQLEEEYEPVLQTQIRVPNMVDDYYKDWYNKITTNLDYGFGLRKIEEFSETVEEGIIISQEPKGDQTVLSGANVVVTVSLGSKIRILPDIYGLSLSEAEKLLDEEGLIPEVSYATSSIIPPGSVIYYGGDYLTGDEVDYGTIIPIYVSIGD